MFGLRKPAARRSTPDASAPPARLSSRQQASTQQASTQQASKQLSSKERGQQGEDAAAALLQSNGYQIVERNWRAGNSLRGEIDCIGWTSGDRGEKVLAFVEVKTRRDNAHGAPQEAVTLSKQRQIARLANAYVSIRRLDNIPCRFDVVEVWLNDDSAPRCVLHRNAFECAPG